MRKTIMGVLVGALLTAAVWSFLPTVAEGG